MYMFWGPVIRHMTQKRTKVWFLYFVKICQHLCICSIIVYFFIHNANSFLIELRSPFIFYCCLFDMCNVSGLLDQHLNFLISGGGRGGFRCWQRKQLEEHRGQVGPGIVGRQPHDRRQSLAFDRLRRTSSAWTRETTLRSIRRVKSNRHQ